MDVDVWSVVLDVSPATVARMRPLLSADECERAGNFLREREANRFVVQRAELRRILASYLQIPPQAVQLAYSADGKPYLREFAGQLSFSVSHSHERAVYAVTDGRPVGVDVELLRDFPEMDRIAESFFLPDERDHVLRLSGQDKQRVFFRYWTAKEAFVKALGTGLHALSGIPFTAPPAGVDTTAMDRSGRLWTLRDFDIAPEYVAALVTEAHQATEPLRIMLKKTLAAAGGQNTEFMTRCQGDLVTR